ncbi:hypothetical protein P7C71_g6131, partial [Lecanoromycetidae sp. Uapishka_2]
MESFHVSLMRSVLFTLILFLKISFANSGLQLRAPNPVLSCLSCCGSDSDPSQPSTPSTIPLQPLQPNVPYPPVMPLQEIAAQEAATDDAPTPDSSAGIGMEFEAGSLRFKSDTLAAKGDNAQTDAYIAGNPGFLNAEYILNGKLIKLGTGDLKRAAAAVQDSLSNPNTVTVTDCNIDDWKIDRPENPGDVDQIAWEPQATAPMPLEGIQELISTVVGDQLPISPLLIENDMVLVTKDFFQKVDVKPENLTDDVLGFFSLMMSYIKADWTFGDSGSIKKLVPIMPRTDFTSIYISQMKKTIPSSEFYDVCKELACFRNDGSGIAPGPSIKDWIQGISQGIAPDALSVADARSIGALGPTMENVLGSYSQFADFADQIEQEVIRLHKKYASAPKVRKRKPTGTMVSPIHRRASQCTPCPQGCPAKPSSTVWLSQNPVHIGNANEVNNGKTLRDQAFKDIQALCPDNQNSCDSTDSAEIDGVWIVSKGDGGDDMQEGTLQFQFSDSQYFSTDERDAMIAQAIAAWQQASTRSCTDAPEVNGREENCDAGDPLKERENQSIEERGVAAWLSSLHPILAGAAPDYPCRTGGKICSAPNHITVILPTSDPTQPNHMNIAITLQLDQGESIWDKFICEAIIAGLAFAAETFVPELIPEELTEETLLEALCDGDEGNTGTSIIAALKSGQK